MENQGAVLEAVDEQRQQNLSAFEHSPGPWSIENAGEHTVTLRDANDKVIGIICVGNAEGLAHVGTFAECKGNIAIISAALEAAIMNEQVGKGIEICESMITSMETVARL